MSRCSTSSPKGIEEFWEEVDRFEIDPNFGSFNIPFPEPQKERFKIPYAAHRVRSLQEIDTDLKQKAEHLGKPTAPPRDNVNLPHHYARYKIEPIQFLMENKVDAFQFNIIKYVLRHDAKNGLEDIRKVLRYAEMYLKYLSGDPDWWKPSTMTIGGYESCSGARRT